MRKIAISLLTCNNKDLVQATLDSLINSDIVKHKLKLFVWVNECLDRKEWEDFFIKYQEFFNLCLAVVPENIGIVKPRIILYNEMKKENFDYLLEIHDDMLFPSLWFDNLLESFDLPLYDSGNNSMEAEKSPAIAMPFIVADFEMDYSQSKINEVCYQFKEKKLYFNTIQNHPWLIDFKALKKYGYYDTVFHPQICEDDDLYFRMILAGEYTVTNKNSIVMHKKGFTRESKLPMILDNLRLIKARHGDHLDNLKAKYLYYDDNNKDFYKGEFAWLLQENVEKKLTIDSSLSLNMLFGGNGK